MADGEKTHRIIRFFGAQEIIVTGYHAGVDLYPEGGAGSSVKAMADGSIIKIAPFYTGQTVKLPLAFWLTMLILLPTTPSLRSRTPKSQPLSGKGK